ncbi:glycosyltransferase [Candidatus Saccharibacteria bacterium]|nr:glycosyltransferase [Candidatus Saccharibacteria bacterium]MBP9489737.1 glycosyltransferase [Candidatus Saccharibacteria bacterium]
MTHNPAWLKDKKVVIVADWLTTYGGAEKVVKAVHEIFPEAPIYASQYSKKQINWFEDCDVRTGWVNIFPASLRKILSIPRAIYFSRLNLSDYDIIISIVTAESKGVKTVPNQLHISYLQGPPTQYFWGMYDKYVENPGFGRLNFFVRFFFKLLVRPLRKVDYKYAKRPDFMIANSTYSKNDILKYYGRQSTVVFPPVEIDKFKINPNKEDFLISTSRQVNWKRLDLAVEACKITGNKLVLVGSGAEHEKLVKLAGGSSLIEFVPLIKNANELASLVGRASGFVFPSLEPFGIAPIEALSTGTPIIALKAGGALDYVKEGKNGIFFDDQTVDSLAAGIKKFNKTKFDTSIVSDSVKSFSEKNFKRSFENFIKEKYDQKY